MNTSRLFLAALVGAYLTLFGVGMVTVRHAPAWCETASQHIAAQLYAAAQE